MPFFRNPFARSSSTATTRAEPLRDESEEAQGDNNNNSSNNSSSRRNWFRGGGRPSPPPNATLFCWFCDMRIATILLNVLHMIFSTFLELFEMTGRFLVSEPPLLYILCLVFSGLGVFGALHFNMTAVFTATLGLIFLFVLYLSEEHVFGLVLLVMIVYSHFVFMVEIKRGIMTHANYEQHQYMDEMGQEALQKAHSFASDVGDATKDVVVEVTRTASNALSISSAASAVSVKKQRQEEC
jgi:hypothetical protein